MELAFSDILAKSDGFGVRRCPVCWIDAELQLLNPSFAIAIYLPLFWGGWRFTRRLGGKQFRSFHLLSEVSSV